MNPSDGRILIVDDDSDVRRTAELFLRQKFGMIKAIASPEMIPAILEEFEFDLILLDMNFSRGDMDGEAGLEWLRRIKKSNPDIVVIMITAYGEINLAVEAMKQGASDFVLKPWNNEKLFGSISAGLALNWSRKEVKRLSKINKAVSDELDRPFIDMIGQSPAINRVYELIGKVADTDANILILGENGTGKELVARALHRQSSRRDQPFIRVDLGAISETLFESELFGHVKGAFTDAKADRTGSFELADNGTLFLDEIGNLSLNLQTKLLSVIQQREVIKVGSNKKVPVNVRLISATNMPLYELAQKSQPLFRMDLLYRINTVEIKVPPLRERREDIRLLVNHFMDHYARHYNKPKLPVPDEVIKHLETYDWPGNIRELQHGVEKALILNNAQLMINDRVLKTASEDSETSEAISLEDMESRLIRKSIDMNRGNLSKVASELGITRATLYRKIEKYGLS